MLVTGASRRIAIGAGIARRLVADGAAVVLHSWSAHDAEQPWGADLGGPEGLVEELRSQDGQVEHFAADLADPDAPARVVDAARRAFGHLDVVVANHARSSGQALEQVTAEEIDLSYAVNTRATLLLVKAFAAQHDGRPGGRVVLFTSGQYHGAMPSELPYIASKGALHQLTPSLAAHLIPRGITVNCLDPGPNDTGYADAQTGSLSPPATRADAGALRPTPRVSLRGWSATRLTGSPARSSPLTGAGPPSADATGRGQGQASVR